MSGIGSSVAVAQAFNRFGLGGRPTDATPSDPVAWLRAQLAAPDPTPVAGLPTVAQGLALSHALESNPAGSPAGLAAVAALQALFSSETQTFLSNAVVTPAPFRERLVWFWANHFAVMAADHHRVACCAGAYVRDAIRPYVTGTFSQMLMAVMTHPAMICSLDNEMSVGPQSQDAVAAARGQRPLPNINENLGRETLELYTVGVGAGYTQADVDAMAYLLTGWTVNLTTPPMGYMYDPTAAQPGSQTLMGATFPCTQAGCTAALQALATSPYTYQHLATKLVTHFIADTPAPSDVAAVYNALASTGGNLEAAALALVGLPNAWTPLTKLRTPLDLTIASMRAAGLTAATVPANINQIVTALGQPTWCPPFPNGWSDHAADWTSPEAMVLRIDSLSSFCATLPSSVTPATIAAAALGPLLSPHTTAALSRISALQSQLTVLFSSPEFQRR